MKRLIQLKNDFGNKPLQNTEAWLDEKMNRKNNVGMSKLFSWVQGEYAPDQPSNLEKNDNLYWGCLFEPVAKQLLCMRLNVSKVHEFGSINHYKYPFSCSPDGLVVDKDNTLHLIEIKCPRISDKKGLTNQHYKSQLLGGLDLLNVPCGLFSQNFFRLCSLSQLFASNPNYNYMYHYRKQYDCYPMYFGYLHLPMDIDVVDLGKEKTLERVFSFPADLWNIHIAGTSNYGNPHTIAKGFIIPWKLFAVHDVRVRKEDNYLENMLLKYKSNKVEWLVAELAGLNTKFQHKASAQPSLEHTTPKSVCEILYAREEINETDKVLDLMAGDGALTQGVNANIISVEIDHSRVEKGKELYPTNEWIEADVFSYDFIKNQEEQSFDYVFTNPDFRYSLSSVRLGAWFIKPTGKLCALLPTAYFTSNRTNYLKKWGLKIVKRIDLGYRGYYSEEPQRKRSTPDSWWVFTKGVYTDSFPNEVDYTD